MTDGLLGDAVHMTLKIQASKGKTDTLDFLKETNIECIEWEAIFANNLSDEYLSSIWSI